MGISVSTFLIGGIHIQAGRLRSDGAAFEVYYVLGYGMAEEIYQQNVEIELGLRKIPLQSKADHEVTYKGQVLTTVYRPDLLVFDDIVVELKAATALAPEHQAQLFNDMRFSKTKVGYPIDFLLLQKIANGNDSLREYISVD